MTFTDFIKTVRHYCVLVLTVIIVCTLAGGAFGFLKSEKESISADTVEAEQAESAEASNDLYMAISTLLVSSQATGVGGIASAEADLWSREHNERYGEWLVAENERKQEQLSSTRNTSTKKSIETAPGSWLKAGFADNFKDLTVVEAQSDKDANSVIVVAIGPDPQECVDASVEVAEKTESIAHELYDGDSSENGETILNLSKSQTLRIQDKTIKIELIKANSVTRAYPLTDEDVLLSSLSSDYTSSDEQTGSSSFKSLIKFGAVGFFGGVILALIIILLMDMIRKPIRNADEIAESLDIPVLASPANHDKADVLLANIRLAAGDEAKILCVAAINDPTASACIFNKIIKSNESSDLGISNVGPLSSSGKAVCDVAASDGVVLCMREWKDRVPNLEDAINELAIANARLIGIVVLGEK